MMLLRKALKENLSTTRDHPEATGAAFELSIYLAAREKAWNQLSEINLYVEENFRKLSEADLHIKIKESFGQETKFWHPHKVRFGINTRCSFRTPSIPDILLKKGEIYFLDIGPILDQHEADVGQTFCVDNPNFSNPAQILFKKLETLWKEKGLTGLTLYHEARKLAHEMGYILNDKMQGHRLGDFPHALFHRGGLKDYDKSPQKMLWVLEIHLLDKVNERGYFFEDILGAPQLGINA